MPPVDLLKWMCNCPSPLHRRLDLRRQQTTWDPPPGAYFRDKKGDTTSSSNFLRGAIWDKVEQTSSTRTANQPPDCADTDVLGSKKRPKQGALDSFDDNDCSRERQVLEFSTQIRARALARSRLSKRNLALICCHENKPWNTGSGLVLAISEPWSPIPKNMTF
eukprot:2700635-Rhodomonas_salina.1